MRASALVPFTTLAKLYGETERLTNQGQVVQAFDGINRALNLDIDPVSYRAFELVLGKLCEVSRFNGNPHLDANQKGTTGQHTLMVMPFAGVIGTLALDGLRPTFNKQAGVTPALVIASTLHNLYTQVLMHDMGELFIELSSLSQRRLEDNKKEMPTIERHFAEFAMRLAYHCVGQTRDQTQQKKLFDGYIDDVRQSIDTTIKDENVVGDAIAKQIKASITPIATRLHLDVIEDNSVQRHLDYFMAQYDKPEGFSHFSYFDGKVVKHCQNMQTVLHMVKHVNKGQGAPYDLANSQEARNSFWYAERGLHNVYAAVTPGNPVQQAIARSCAVMAYAINLAVLDYPPPLVITREAQLRSKLKPNASVSDVVRAESEPHEAARSDEIVAAQLRWQANNNGLTDFTQPELHIRQLRAAYGAAMDLALRDKNYQPAREPLVDSRQLPPAVSTRMLDKAPLPALPIVRMLNGELAPKRLQLRAV